MKLTSLLQLNLYDGVNKLQQAGKMHNMPPLKRDQHETKVFYL